MEPDLSPDISLALCSPEKASSTRTPLRNLSRRILGNLTLAPWFIPRVSFGANPNDKRPGWVVQMVIEKGELDALLTRTLINLTGLSGPFVLNSFLSRMNPPPPLPPPPLPTIYHAKGSHVSYLSLGASNLRHLIYPVLEVSPKVHWFTGLGAHFTLNLSGNIHLGPDYCGIRPKQAPSIHGFQDFRVRKEWSCGRERMRG